MNLRNCRCQSSKTDDCIEAATPAVVFGFDTCSEVQRWIVVMRRFVRCFLVAGPSSSVSISSLPSCFTAPPPFFILGLSLPPPLAVATATVVRFMVAIFVLVRFLLRDDAIGSFRFGVLGIIVGMMVTVAIPVVVPVLEFFVNVLLHLESRE